VKAFVLHLIILEFIA